MYYFKIFHTGHELNVTCDHAINNIVRIASLNDHVFLVTAAEQLFFGVLNGESRTSIDFELIRNDVIDVDCSNDSIYVVDHKGCVQHCPLMAFDFDKRWNDVPIVNYSAIYEGVVANGSDLVRVVNVNCNNDGVLFTTSDRELYGMGKFEEVCTSDQPIKLPQFINHEILQVAMGKHFAVVLTRRKNDLFRIANNTEATNYDDTMSTASNISLNTLSKSVLDDKLNMRDVSFLGIQKCDENEFSTPTNSNDFSIVNSVNSENGASIKTITNNTDVESSSSEYNSVAVDVEHEVGKLTRTGNDYIRTQVWCFGSVNKGQLGTGDHIKRKQAVEIESLSEQGVRQLSCGDEHTAAMTLDGRLYLWGDNSNEQISHWLEKEDCSSPKRYYKTEQNVYKVKCGQFSTFILANNMERSELSRNKHFTGIKISTEFDANYNEHQSDHLLLASKQFLIVGNTFRQLKSEKYLKFEQQFLQDILQKTRPFFQNFLRTMSRNVVKHPFIYRQFFHQYNSITDLSAVNILTILNYAGEVTDFETISFIRNYQEYIHVFRLYTKHYCEIICSDDFAKACQFITPNADFVSKFSTPLQHICNFIEFMRELMLIEGNRDSELLKLALNHWEQFRCEMDVMLKSADTTISFWNSNQKNVPGFLQLPHRRIILDSKELPLKLLPSSRFTSNWFILFNDIFCHSSGSNTTIKQYPLRTLWISSVTDKDASSTASSSSSSSATSARKYALKITTPEEQFVVSAQSNDVKTKWLQLIEQHVKQALEKPTAKTILACRTTTYTFSEKHKVFPMCKYTGQWFYGKLHGIGCMEYLDGRVYTGQFDMGVINGHGRLVVPNFSCYEGRFINGKYDGQGSLEMHTLSGTYEGSFKNGLQNGHGISIDNNKTYIGEFANGVPHGYGVLDDSISGEKYMGMFVENNRSGYGFCITVEGKYFEGSFVDNELNGNGVAVFNNGSYYEGDLMLNGPSGRGALFLPAESVQNENCFDLDDRRALMRGNVLSGSLGGIWDDVKVNNGNIALNQEFGKYPSTLGQSQIENKQKWLSLFADWERDVFGMPINEISDTKKIWHKISEHSKMVNQHEILKSTITTSAILYESGQTKAKQHYQQQHHNHLHHHLQSQSQTDHFLNIIQAGKNYDRQVSKSFSLSRITGKNYKRNLLAIERTKSISNEFLNNANFFHDNEESIECNNNKPGDRMLLPSAMKNAAPSFGVSKLDKDDMRLVRDYLTKAFKSRYHPFGILNSKVSYCFYTSYGCWKVKPSAVCLLSTHAMKEWECISKRIYDIVRRLFPTLPMDYGNLDDEFISHRSLLYPILLSEGVYSTLFVLYANKCSKHDELYRQRILFSDKKTDIELMEFLKIASNYLTLIQHEEFGLAINALRQVKEKFCPREMLKLIEVTFKHIEKAAEMISTKQNTNVPSANNTQDLLSASSSPANDFPLNAAAACKIVANAPPPPPSSPLNQSPPLPVVQLNADNMMPLTIFLLLRAAIPHLGTEILLLEDLMGTDFEFVMHGYAGYCFTTIKAAYQHIINESFLQ